MRIIYNFLLLFLVIIPIAFAHQVKYRNSDGAILAMAASSDMQAGPGETVVEVNQAIPSDLSMYKWDGEFREKNAQEIQDDTDVKDVEKAERKARKKAIRQKLGMTELDIQALVELIKDENED